MKLKQALLPLAALSLAASLAIPSAALADDDAAYSANVVGVLRYTIPSNGVLTCITLPLDPINGTNDTWNWSDTSLAQQMDRGTIAYFWNGEDWDPSLKQRSSWSTEHTVAPGQAVFVQGPTTATEDKIISFLGQLPVAPTNYFTLVGNSNLTMTAVSTYPVERLLSESALKDLPRSSIVYQWDGQGWQPSLKQRSSWSTDLEFGVGEGAFVQLNGESQIIEETCPFVLQQ